MSDTSLLFVFATPISSVTGACGGTRQSITVPSLPAAVLSCVFIALASSFLLLLIHCLFLPLLSLKSFAPFIPCLDLHIISSLLFPLPSLFHCSKPALRMAERTCHTDCEVSYCFFTLAHTHLDKVSIKAAQCSARNLLTAASSH